MAIKKQIGVNIDGTTYTVKFPTIGQLMDIESFKMGLTNNSYPDLIRSGLNRSFMIAETVDAVVHFMVLVPEVAKDLNVRSYTDLDPILSKKLTRAYRKDIKPWIDELMVELMRDEDIEIPSVDDIKEVSVDDVE